MELNYVLTVLDRDKQREFEVLLKDAEIPLSLITPGQGTATKRLLDYFGLQDTEKAVIMTIADGEKTRQLFRRAKNDLMIDIPGHGIMMVIPVKSVGGGRTLAYLTDNGAVDQKVPDLNVENELILIIANSGYTDDVMDVAREAGAKGGTVIHAKGTGAEYAMKFFGVSLAEEKEVIMILASSKNKKGIMKAIADQKGPTTPAGAICMSIPVTEVAGVRKLED